MRQAEATVRRCSARCSLFELASVVRRKQNKNIAVLVPVLQFYDLWRKKNEKAKALMVTTVLVISLFLYSFISYMHISWSHFFITENTFI